jgi:dolichol-phosphate mannosyltransferase
MSASLTRFSLVIPARDEAGCIRETLELLGSTLREAKIPFELVVVDDGSTDDTGAILEGMRADWPELAPVLNPGPHGIGLAIRRGLQAAQGDAVAIFMADASDDPGDVVRYWEALQAGYECVFGSRFIPGSQVHDYPRLKWFLNRMANAFIRLLFRHGLNDTTNAFKAYRKEVIQGCHPILSPHFNITVELPLKAIIRGYSYTVIPISWTNRKTGESKLKIREMGSRYFFIVMYLWLEKYFSRGDYYRKTPDPSSKKIKKGTPR